MQPSSAPVWPLDSQQTLELSGVLQGLSVAQLQWASGYAAGLAAAQDPAANAAIVAPAAAAATSITILFGSQTGNGEAVAKNLRDVMTARGIGATLSSLADYKPSQIKREEHVAIVISTQGEGDPPDDAELFHEFLLGDKAPQLDNLKFSVLALGDSSYANYCSTGREIDGRLEALGATRFAPIVECDLDYDDAAFAWSSSVTESIASVIEESATPSSTVRTLHAVPAANAYDKNNPFVAEVLVNQKITGASSSKDVRHVELSIAGSGIVYEPGDALAVIPLNPPSLVESLLNLLALRGDTEVQHKEEKIKLADALSSRVEITALNTGFLRAWADLSGAKSLQHLLAAGDPEALGDYLFEQQIIDVIRAHPHVIEAQAFVNLLRPLAPRSYSIASSLAANPDEVHLTVAAVRYQAHGHEHWGAASTYLVDRLEPGSNVAVFVEKNNRFRLPTAEVPIIMIGPGTGVAPFRAFIEERIEIDASGDNWLIFGERNFDSDFLYQLEWQRYRKSGALTRLDVAFSRDQRDKVYVQDRIRENAAELYRWIQRGAAIYVCGDSKSMAPDVNAAIVDVLVREGGLTTEAAAAELKELKRSGRYLRDVY